MVYTTLCLLMDKATSIPGINRMACCQSAGWSTGGKLSHIGKVFALEGKKIIHFLFIFCKARMIRCQTSLPIFIIMEWRAKVGVAVIVELMSRCRFYWLPMYHQAWFNGRFGSWSLFKDSEVSGCEIFLSIWLTWISLASWCVHWYKILDWSC